MNQRNKVINLAIQKFLNLLADHSQDEFCNYLYLELTLGDNIIDSSLLECLVSEVLEDNGSFKTKDGIHCTMDDLIKQIISYINLSLQTTLVNWEDEIIEKYGEFAYDYGIEWYLQQALFGKNTFNRYSNGSREMVRKYFLKPSRSKYISL